MLNSFSPCTKLYKLINLLGLHVTQKAEGGDWREDNHYPLGAEFDLKRIAKEKMDQKRGDARIDLARKLTAQRRYQKAIDILQEIIESDHNNDHAYLELGITYESGDMDKEAVNMYRKAVAINGRNSFAQYKLGRLLAEMEEFGEAEQRIRIAIEITPSFSEAYPELGYVYLARKEYKKAHDIVSKGLAIDPSNDRALGIVERINNARGGGQDPTEYREKAKVRRGRFYNEMTYNNYQKLTRILAEKEIQLISVQYPVRDVDSLKMILESAKGIIFVDNEKVFKDALKNSSYDEYFTDLFAGDFGHCTEKGNKLLASNVARVILREHLGYSDKDN